MKHISSPHIHTLSSSAEEGVASHLRDTLAGASELPGTKGRKTKLRLDGHGSNHLVGGPSFFVTPNCADTYNPIVKLLHVLVL